MTGASAAANGLDGDLVHRQLVRAAVRPHLEAAAGQRDERGRRGPLAQQPVEARVEVGQQLHAVISAPHYVLACMQNGEPYDCAYFLKVFPDEPTANTLGARPCPSKFLKW